MEGGSLLSQLANLGLSMGDNKNEEKSGGKTRRQGLIEMSKRSFTVESATGLNIPQNASMRYISSTPYAAAAKATRRLYSLADDQKKKLSQIRFILRETTQGMGSKTFKYIGVRRKYDKPVVVSLNGKEIVYNYGYNVKSCIDKK